MIYIIEALNRFFQIDIVWLLLSMVVGTTSFKFLKNKVSLEHRIYSGILHAYATLVLCYTIFSRTSTGVVRYALDPLWGYKLFGIDDSYKMDIVLNYILFIPIGFLLPRIIRSRNKYAVTFIMGFLFTCTIEVVQLITTRGLFEFQDILGNTLGTVIGFTAYYLYRRLRHIRKFYITHNRSTYRRNSYRPYRKHYSHHHSHHSNTHHRTTHHSFSHHR